MLNRRDLLLSGSMMMAAAGAFALTPRTHLKLLGDREIADLVPTKVGDWHDMPSNAFVLPKTEGGLAERLYSQTISRLYGSPTNIPIMLVVAYGDLQSDLLQLHRPESCYTAVGFQISSSSVAAVNLGPGAALPVRELTATSDSRIEPIVYWTRIGDALPTDGSQQRSMKLQQSFAGIIPDGILVRISTVAESTPEVFAALREFARELMLAIPAANRPVLIGRPLARLMG